MMSMESAVTFSRSPLIGILTAAADRVEHRPVVVFLNAGLVHRVGPSRLHVRLARELAGRSFTSFRFDLSGIGDSLPRQDGASVHDARLRDVQDALDHLCADTGASSFVLFGLCSGADLAFRVAVADPRVVGLILIDAFPYSTTRGRIYRAARRGWSRLRQARWRRLMAQVGPVLRRIQRSTAATTAPTDRHRDVPTRAEAEAGLQHLIHRGTRLLVAYTPDRDYTYPRHFADAFPGVRSDLINVRYFKNADHTFTLQANQQLLLSAVTGWIACFE
jgi:pimeloyl-ACP methyl ester carboxylesterase